MDSTKVELTERVYDDIKNDITQLSDSLKVGAEFVFEAIVKQQVVDSIIYSTLLAIGVFILIPCIKIIINKKNYYKDIYGGSEPTAKCIVAIILAFIGFSITISGLVHVDNIVTGFVNPEYGSMKEIVELAKCK